MTKEHLIEKALEIGFTGAASLNVDTVELKQEVRDMCAMNTCRRYGTNWACPPGCGSLEECAKRVEPFKDGIIVQYAGDVEDSLDYEGMQDVQTRFAELYKEFTDWMRDIFKEVLPLTAGSCNICKECTCPDEPCRFPDKAISSMEAYGMVVNEVCTANQLAYNYGPQKMAYTGCYLFN